MGYDALRVDAAVLWTQKAGRKKVKSVCAAVAPGGKGLIFSVTSTFRPEPGRNDRITFRKRVVFEFRPLYVSDARTDEISVALIG
jgi:hypothetical protein